MLMNLMQTIARMCDTLHILLAIAASVLLLLRWALRIIIPSVDLIAQRKHL